MKKNITITLILIMFSGSIISKEEPSIEDTVKYINDKFLYDHKLQQRKDLRYTGYRFPEILTFNKCVGDFSNIWGNTTFTDDKGKEVFIDTKRTDRINFRTIDIESIKRTFSKNPLRNKYWDSVIRMEANKSLKNHGWIISYTHLSQDPEDPNTPREDTNTVNTIGVYNVSFESKDTAMRVAKALIHLAQKCGATIYQTKKKLF